MSLCHYAMHFENADGTVSNYRIGKNKVAELGCTYIPKALDILGGYTFEASTWWNRIVIIPSKNIDPIKGTNIVDLTGAYVADTPTKTYQGYNKYGRRNVYGYMGGRGYVYYQAPELIHVSSLDIVPDLPFRMGRQLIKDILSRGVNGNDINACCRDDYSGINGILTYNKCTVNRMYRWHANNSWDFWSGSIAYGHWYQDMAPEYIKHADMVTVVDVLNNYPGHPHLSYFRSASILYSNTPEPNDIPESEAEKDNPAWNCNFVFEFDTNKMVKGQWYKLYETETWDDSIVDGNDKWNHNATWLWFGGSRCAIYYSLTDEGLAFGATGDMGDKLDWGETCNGYDYNTGLCLEMTNSSWWCTNCADFNGIGIRIKARLRLLD